MRKFIFLDFAEHLNLLYTYGNTHCNMPARGYLLTAGG
jgi:hypothetical protein